MFENLSLQMLETGMVEHQRLKSISCNMFERQRKVAVFVKVTLCSGQPARPETIEYQYFGTRC